MLIPRLAKTIFLELDICFQSKRGYTLEKEAMWEQENGYELLFLNAGHQLLCGGRKMDMTCYF
jgi:hypothetical protein